MGESRSGRGIVLGTILVCKACDRATAFISPFKSCTSISPIPFSHSSTSILTNSPHVRRRSGTLVSSSSNTDSNSSINEQFEKFLHGPSLLELVDFVKRHRSQIDLDWSKNIEEREVAQGRQDSSKNRNIFSPATIGRQQFMLMEAHQREQMEAVVLFYGLLKEKRLLRGYSSITDTRAYADQFLPKPVGAAEIEARADLQMKSLTPGQAQNYWIWGGALLCLLELWICQYIGVDAGSVIPATILGFFADRFILGGRVFDGAARALIPRYKERIIRHEAGHFLLAYLLGCPVQSCILRPVFNGAVFGAAGTVFLDQKLFQELDANRISASSVDRYTTVVMAGIAAEALMFKNAEGGASDEQTIVVLLSLMNPPWDFGRITTQARWAALRAVLILKDYRETYEALVQSLTEGKTLGDCIEQIESSLSSRASLVPPTAMGLGSSLGSPSQRLTPSLPESDSQAPTSFNPPSRQDYDDLKKVLLPPDQKPSELSEQDLSVLDAMRKVDATLNPETSASNLPSAGSKDVIPSFAFLEGQDPIRLREQKEEKLRELEEERLRVKMAQIDSRLREVTGGLSSSTPGDTSAGGTAESAASQGEEDGRNMEQEVDAQLAKINARLRELREQLGETGMERTGRR